jgi:hypothetical protein
VPGARSRRPVRDRHGRRGPDRIEQLAAGEENDAGAAQGEQQAAGARELLHVMVAALDRADGDRVNHQERLEPGLDGEQAGDALQHAHG